MISRDPNENKWDNTHDINDISKKVFLEHSKKPCKVNAVIHLDKEIELEKDHDHLRY